MITIADIAEKAGVAKSTVSNVLSNKKYVSDELSRKILKICKEMNFQPNFCASTLIKGGTNIIALFLEQNDKRTYQSFYNELIKSCVINASNANFNVIIYYGMDDDKIITLLMQGKAPIDGAIILSPCLNDERINSINANRIPCVIIGRSNGVLENLSQIDVDNYKLCYDIGAKLILSGYSRICLINSKKDLTISIDRINGFCDAIKDNGDTSSFVALHSDNSIIEEGYTLAKEALSKNIDVIVTANEYLAQGVYKALKEKGVVIGKDISVFALGCEGLDPLSLSPALSYSHQDYFEIGKRSVEMLINEIHTGTASESELCQCSIYFNESCPVKEM